MHNYQAQQGEQYIVLFKVVSKTDYKTPVTGITPSTIAYGIKKPNFGFDFASGGTTAEVEVQSTYLPGWYSLTLDEVDTDTIGTMLVAVGPPDPVNQYIDDIVINIVGSSSLDCRLLSSVSTTVMRISTPATPFPQVDAFARSFLSFKNGSLKRQQSKITASNQQFGIITAGYIHSTKAIYYVGAFTDYTFQSGDMLKILYGSGGPGTDVAPQYAEIASKYDDDTIILVDAISNNDVALVVADPMIEITVRDAFTTSPTTGNIVKIIAE